MDSKQMELDRPEIRLMMEALSKVPLAMIDPRYRVAVMLMDKLQKALAMPDQNEVGKGSGG